MNYKIKIHIILLIPTNFKEELNSNIKLDFYFLEKLDIFCLILNDNKSEAYLLNSILLSNIHKQSTLKSFL